MNESKKQKKFPKLRFLEFNDEWKMFELGDFLIHEQRIVSKPNNLYKGIGLRSHFKGTFQRLNSDPAKISMDNLFVVKNKDFIVNITFAWEGALAIAKEDDEGGLVSHRFPTYVFNQDIITAEYFRYVFPTKKMKYNLENISPGGAGRNRVLNKKDFLNLKIKLPSLAEQQKISSFLVFVDDWIQNLKSQKNSLEKYKKGMVQKIFSQEIRFKDDKGNDFEGWKERRLGTCLDYEQPTKYIVESTEYNNSYKTPVLTAGKGFILGYTNENKNIFKKADLPVIIFDDFTTASQFVDFPFKVKSSAMKILKTKAGFNIKFMFEILHSMKYEIGGHGRHWISKFSNILINVPCFEEQQKIAEFLTSLDKAIDSKQSQIKFAEEWKKCLMQGLFV